MKKLIIISTLLIVTGSFAIMNTVKPESQSAGGSKDFRQEIPVPDISDLIPISIHDNYTIHELVLAGGKICGHVIAGNTRDSLFITVVSTKNTEISESGFYIGGFDGFPVDGSGRAICENFPFRILKPESGNYHRFSVPLKELDDPTLISVYTDVRIKYDPETAGQLFRAWAGKIRFDEEMDFGAFFEYEVNNYRDELSNMEASL